MGEFIGKLIGVIIVFSLIAALGFGLSVLTGLFGYELSTFNGFVVMETLLLTGLICKDTKKK